MGACSSCEAVSVVSGTATAKVVLSDGGLREYLQPVTAYCVLGKDTRGFFVCDADEMEIDGLLGAVGADEQLRPGQLYFVLPRSMLKHPLHADDIKALVVKASEALVGRRGKGAVAPLVFPVEEAEAEAGNGSIADKRARSGSRGKGPRFAPDLSAIPE